jgi:hypothetical protein
MVGQWEDQGRCYHSAQDAHYPSSITSCCLTNHFEQGDLHTTGVTSYFSEGWQSLSLRWRCCRFNVGGAELSFCVKMALLCLPLHGRRSYLSPYISVYNKVTAVISTWSIASDSSEGGTLERTRNEGGDSIMCHSIDQLTLTGLGRSGAWMEGVHQWGWAQPWIVYLVLRPLLSSSLCFLVVIALPSQCGYHRARHDGGCQQTLNALKLWAETNLPFKVVSPGVLSQWTEAKQNETD